VAQLTGLKFQCFVMQKAEYLLIYGPLRKALRNPISSVLTRYGELKGEATLRGKLYDPGMYRGAILFRATI